MTALVVVLAVAVGLLALLVAGLLRSHAEILRILHGLGVSEDDVLGRAAQPAAAPAAAGAAGGPAADVAGATPQGGAARIGVVGVAHPTLLGFLSTGCATCRPFWEGAGDAPALPGDPRLVAVTKGPEAESPGAVAALAPAGVPLVMSTEAFTRYAVPATPYFVLVDGPSGRIAGEGTAASWAQLGGLLRRAAADAGMTRQARRRFADRLRDTDAELAAAGIEPGDPTLYPGRDAP